MEKGRPFAAHIAENGRVQTVQEHLLGTAQRARAFAAVFGAGDMAYQCGLAHDVGKFSDAFQHRIWDNGPKVDHTSAGAKIIGPLTGYPAAYSIAGHHAGLMDGGSSGDVTFAGTLQARLSKPVDPKVLERYPKEVQLHRPAFPPLKMLGSGGFTESFFTRMLFSCLVDADFLDTEAFMKNGKTNRSHGCDIYSLSDKLDAYVQPWWSAKTELNKKRCKILRTCLTAGEKMEKGLFTLTVPTGGGKTISSLAFALHHAKEHGMKRIIYVIPYCSIIEQTADVFREALGTQNVLEHHSGAQYDDSENEEMSPKRLAAENWDMPVVVTTAVQFFQSLFASKTSACRKLHNLADSVIIFDEAQTLPLPYLKPCVRAIAELTVNYGSSCVLCTATQPALGPLFREVSPKIEAHEICPDTKNMYSFFRRVRYEKVGELTDEVLASRLSEEQQVLCIVTTRNQAQNVYQMLKGPGSFHLSTLMTPNHRRAVLKEIRHRLQEGQPCRVVSTSLIEAGVDVDFPTVYRACAGLDSEIQAGGRCNRENKRPAEKSVVYLFQPESKYRRHLPAVLSLPAQTAEKVTRGVDEIDMPEVITAYFSELYQLKGETLDSQQIVPDFEEGIENHHSFPFRTVAQHFRLIPDNTRAILIPRDDESRLLAARLQAGERSRELFRQLGQCSVNVYERDFMALMPSLDTSTLDESIAILVNPKLYHDDTGLQLSDEGGYGYLV
ncbi:MAG: CRISPR-associated helicase Cas3' [Oscillospiraceae bacterium]|nr:CRISPR-associated helicase Cas3' [Oscillospiraceae bacterium]